MPIIIPLYFCLVNPEPLSSEDSKSQQAFTEMYCIYHGGADGTRHECIQRAFKRTIPSK